MRINFYEEYPSQEAFERFKLWPHETTVFIAYRSLFEFVDWMTQLKVTNPKVTPAYWPVLKDSYYVSPFSDPEALSWLYTTLKSYHPSKGLKVLIDLELPYAKGYRHLFLKNRRYFRENLRIIEKILLLSNVHCFTAEDPWTVGGLGFFARRLGVSYPELTRGMRGIMFYSSLLNNGILRILNNRTRFCNALAKDMVQDPHISVSVGTIAVGARGNEPIVSLAELRKDLAALQKVGVQEVVIFRLGGLTPDYVRVLEDFASA